MGQYFKVKSDGADWRCTECQELKPHNEVILLTPVPGAPLPWARARIICLECVDPEWMGAAKCLGTK